MSKTAVFQTRIDPKLKKDVEKVVTKYGLTMSDVTTLLFKELQRTQSIPFELLQVEEERMMTIEEEKSLETALKYGWASKKEVEELLGI